MHRSIEDTSTSTADATTLASTASNAEPVTEETPLTIEMYDVLCGRDKNAFNNIGNRRFRVLVAMSLDQYVNVAKSRKEKSAIVRNIIERTKSCGGRFLALRDRKYVELNDRETHDKVGHAVRDMAQARSKGSTDTIQISGFECTEAEERGTDVVVQSYLHVDPSSLPDSVNNVNSDFNNISDINALSNMKLNEASDKNVESGLHDESSVDLFSILNAMATNPDQMLPDAYQLSRESLPHLIDNDQIYYFNGENIANQAANDIREPIVPLITSDAEKRNSLEFDFIQKLSFDRVSPARPSRRASVESIATFGDCTIDTVLTTEKADTFVFEQSSYAHLHNDSNWEFPCTSAERDEMEYIVDLDHRFGGMTSGIPRGSRRGSMEFMQGHGRRGSMEFMQGYGRRGSTDMHGFSRPGSIDHLQGFHRQGSTGTSTYLHGRIGSMGTTTPSMYGRRGSISTIGTIGEDDHSMGLAGLNERRGSNQTLMSTGRRNSMGNMTSLSSMPRYSIGNTTLSNIGRSASMETLSTHGRRASVGTVDSDALDQLIENMFAN